MKRMLFVAGVLFFLWWRHERFDGLDRDQGYGAYAPVVPSGRS